MVLGDAEAGNHMAITLSLSTHMKSHMSGHASVSDGRLSNSLVLVNGHSSVSLYVWQHLFPSL